MSARRGFTLIELLVVISIIALLIAILLPALKQASESAEKAQCAVNCRQVVVGIHAYATDHNGKTPPSKYDLGEGIGGVYAIYRPSFPNLPDVGRWRRIGPLVDQGYLTDPWAMYCPSLVQDHPWLRPGGIDRYFCGYIEPEADGSLPSGLAIMVYSYHYRESYYDENISDYRTLNIEKDSPDEVVFADSFSAISRGVDYHHRDGYNFSRLDGSTDYYLDPSLSIRNLANGSNYNSNYPILEIAWEAFRSGDEPNAP
ncbi:MAG: type II secretion system protein [Phycisphaeraceae bacterium]